MALRALVALHVPPSCESKLSTPTLSILVQAPDSGLPAPDVVLYLTLPLDVAERRGDFGLERYERRELQQQVG